MLPLMYFLLQLEKYVSASKVKYYFAVDTSYVGRKLGLLVFPFTHSVSDFLDSFHWLFICIF